MQFLALGSWLQSLSPAPSYTGEDPSAPSPDWEADEKTETSNFSHRRAYTQESCRLPECCPSLFHSKMLYPTLPFSPSLGTNSNVQNPFNTELSHLGQHSHAQVTSGAELKG